MNIKEALDKVLSGEYKCAQHKDSTGGNVYLYDLTMRTHVRLDVEDLVATNWRVTKRRPS